MLNQIFTLVVCGLLPLILTIGLAILGSLYRRRLAKRIMGGMKEGRFDDFSTPRGARKLRVLSLLALVSMMGIFVTLVLVWANILSYDSAWTLILYVLFLLVGTVAGAHLFKQVLDRLKP